MTEKRRWSVVFKPSMSANSAETKLKETKLFSGTIKKIYIDIPSGHNYSAGIRFVFTGAQSSDDVLPAQLEGAEKYYMGDDDHLELTPNIKIEQGTIEIHGENADTANPHKFVITIEIEELAKELPF